MKLTRKTITNTLVLIVAVIVFVVIGIKTDWVKTWQSVESANVFWVIGGALMMLMSHWLRAARWNMLTEPAGYKLNNRRAFYSLMAGYLVNVATSRGGELVRCGLTAKSEKAPVELLIGTVITERIIDVLMLALVCGLTLLFQFTFIYGFFDKYLFTPIYSAMTLGNILLFIAICLVTVVLFLLYKRSGKKKNAEKTPGLTGIFARFTGGLQTIMQLQSPLRFILYSLGIWCGYWFSTWFILKSLSVTENLLLANALGVLVFSTIGISIPLPAGAGVWGVLTIGLNSVYGLTLDNAKTFALYNLAYSNLMMIIIGALSYFLLWLEMSKTQTSDT